MKSLFILITTSVEEALKKCSLEVVQNYGKETLMVHGQMVTRGDVALIRGAKEEFQKLLATTEKLWTCTAPILGEWVLMQQED